MKKESEKDNYETSEERETELVYSGQFVILGINQGNYYHVPFIL